MSSPTPKPDRAGLRLVAFAGGLVLALAAGFGVGRLTGPVSAPRSASAMPNMPGSTAVDESQPHSHGMTTTGTADQVGGLALSASGYTLHPRAYTAGQPFTFTVDGPDRKPVTQFAINHDKPMHLVVIRRDLSGYQHLHPTMAPDGTWQVDLTLPAPGIWRAYADFVVNAASGQVPLTLGTDLPVAGAYQPGELPAAGRESTVDGMSVTYEGTPQVGTTAPLLFRVFRGGSPMTTLEKYLGAYGHLVVVREGDLGYVHVHPEPDLAGGAVKFWLAAPSPGRYRMFFDFQVDGAVHTAAYTVVVS